MPPSGGQVNNNLDLRIQMPDGSWRYPNNRTTPDPTNNVEDIFIASPTIGTYTIEIRGQNIPNGPQGYAFAIRGGNLVETKKHRGDAFWV